MAFILQGSLKKKKKTPADPTRGYSVTSKARLEEQLLSVSLLGYAHPQNPAAMLCGSSGHMERLWKSIPAANSH